MRKKKAIINILASLLLELVTVLSGLIIPRLIIGTYGSNVNGLINSIGSFVAYITLLQTGVGSAVKAALYKPLAQRNNIELSIIVKTTDHFFKKIAIATIFYIGVLIILFPVIIVKDFDWVYTASLVAIVGISTVAQYFFGITYQMVLEADQVSYIYSAIQIVTLILNTIAVVFLVNIGCSIQIVKLASSVFFIARPIVLSIYTKRRYKIKFDVPSNNHYISQRWDAFAQGIAYFIHSKTDIFVLTLFASFSDISVYGVYAMVTAGLSSLINALDKAVRSAFGNIIACEEKNTLRNSFMLYNTLIHMLATAFFSTASITVFAFVQVYIKNVTDANYVQPIFGVLIITAEFVYCLRSPYNSVIYASGKFKETNTPAAIEAGLNIIISVILVSIFKFGLAGVAVGTLLAMSYRTLSFIYYLSNNILEFTKWSQFRRYGITFFIYFSSIFVLSKFPYNPIGILDWIVYASVIFVIVSLLTFLSNLFFDGTNTRKVIMVLRKKSSPKNVVDNSQRSQ